MSEIACRNINQVVSAKSYVQAGLAGHWDGIENSGLGVHSDYIQSWKDLVNGVPFTTASDQIITHNAVCCSKATNIYNQNTQLKQLFDSIVNGEHASYTIEAVFPTDIEFALVQHVYIRTYPRFDDIGFELSYDMENQTTTLSPWLKDNDTNSVRMLGSNITEKLGMNAMHSIVLVVEDGTDKAGYLNGHLMSQFKYAFNQELNYVWLTGLIHSIRVYSRALEPDEVLNNYVVDKVRFGI